MSKNTDFNYKDWDGGDDPEKSGTFQKASPDILKNRIVLTAKRRLNTSNTLSSSSFMRQTPPTATTLSNETTTPAVTNSVSDAENQAEQNKRSSRYDDKEKKGNNSDMKDKIEDDSEKIHYALICSLNKSVADWISKHVSEDPYCILTPIFDDYQKHLTNIEVKYGKEKFHSNPKDSINIEPNASPTSEEKSNESEAAEETHKNIDEPSQQVQEEGAVYSVRCKMFFKTEGQYVDQGVGALFLKPHSTNGKTQIIFRSYNLTGTVLLNTLLSKSIPVEKVGSKEVIMVCIPTPQSKPIPVTILLKVKAADAADQLYKNIERYKN